MMKRILLFIDNLGSGGAQRRVVNIANLFRARGYSVKILIYHNDVFYKEQIEKIKVDIVEDSHKVNRLIKIIKYLKHTEADIVITFLETPNHIALIAKYLGCKWSLITTESSSKKETFQGVNNRLFNILECKSKFKVCNSFNSAQMWQKKCPWMKKKLIVIYNPVIINWYAFDQLQLRNKKLKIIVPASYQEIKNPFRLIEAVNLLDASDKNRIEINWYGRKEATNGNDSVYRECKRRIEVYNLKDIIKLHSETSNIYRLMMQSDVVGLFSIAEGLPNAICEGMTMGKPVIMTKVSDYNVLIDGNGILCESFAAESIKEALISFIRASDDSLKGWGEQSNIIAKKLFSPESVIEKWINIIERKK